VHADLDACGMRHGSPVDPFCMFKVFTSDFAVNTGLSARWHSSVHDDWKQTPFLCMSGERRCSFIQIEEKMSH
jgi:hypothetical protein